MSAQHNSQCYLTQEFMSLHLIFLLMFKGSWRVQLRPWGPKPTDRAIPDISWPVASNCLEQTQSSRLSGPFALSKTKPKCWLSTLLHMMSQWWVWATHDFSKYPSSTKWFGILHRLLKFLGKFMDQPEHLTCFMMHCGQHIFGPVISHQSSPSSSSRWFMGFSWFSM